MVSVYLPMGYPLVSGQQFDNVIYQGNVVRVYNLQKDPRSDAQLQNRRFLSDIVKMRTVLGLWGKESCKAAMGSHWGSILYQAVKADMESWWSTALTAWNNFGELNQDAWRAAAPYQATFNDVGMIYFALTRVMYRALLHFGGQSFESLEWQENQSAAALAWWVKDLSQAASKGIIDIGWSGLNWVGNWTLEINAACYSGRMMVSDNAGVDSVEFYVFGKGLYLWFTRGPTYGTGELYDNGTLVQTVSFYYFENLYRQLVTYIFTAKKLRRIKYVRKTGIVNLDALQVS